MNYKRLLSMAVLLVLFVFPSFASMVSFLVVETGIEEESVTTQHGSLWEGSLMSVFFDAGHIVTNYPVARMAKMPEEDLSGKIMVDFYEALEGGADYFILGYLEYRNSGGTAVPVMITLKLYSTDSQELLFEQNFPSGNGMSLNEESQIAENAGRIIISHMKD